jgi:hypothetical protein
MVFTMLEPYAVKVASTVLRGVGGGNIARLLDLQEIRVYLFRWLYWWTNASGTWHKHELLQLFINTCHNEHIANIAQQMLQHYYITRLRTRPSGSVGRGAA